MRDIGVGLRTHVAAKEDGTLWQWGIRKLLDGDKPYTELPVRLIASDTVDGCVFVTDTEVLLGGGRPDESRYLFEPAGMPHASEVAQAACFGPFILLLNTQGELSAGPGGVIGEIPLDLGEADGAFAHRRRLDGAFARRYLRERGRQPARVGQYAS